MIRLILAFACTAILPTFSSHPCEAQQVKAFHLSGSGEFEPANIGNDNGGSFGMVLGDGTGISEYTGEGFDFTIDGQSVGSGFNAHDGGNVSWTSGIVYDNGTKVQWPAKSNQTHVITSDDGEIFMQYFAARYTLDLTTGQFGGEGYFQIIGGTGRFQTAKGMVWIEVVVTGSPVEPIPFNYDFTGFIVLDE